MKGSKLLDLFATLTSRERKRFGDFVRSPYFNKREAVTGLFDYLDRHAPRFSERECSKEGAFKAVFAGRYDDQRMRLLMSELLELLKQFLGLEEGARRSGATALQGLQALNRRGLTKHFNYALLQLRRQHGRRGPADPDALLQHYMLEAELGAFLRKNPRSQATNVQATIAALDVFYLVQKLKTGCTILNNQYVVDLEYEILFLDEIMDHLRTARYPDVPLVEIYYQALLMFRHPEAQEHYRQLRTALERHRDRIAKDELTDIYTFAQNYCIRQINRGESAFMEELFGIYRDLLDHELLLEKGRLSPWHYKNIVAVGLRLRQFEWVEAFIREYQQLIAPAFRSNAFTYNMAKLYFHKREYAAVKRLLLEVEYEDIFYNLDSKVMLLKIYVEEGEYLALDSLINSFRMYLKRNRLVSEDHRVRYLNLVRAVGKMMRLPENDKSAWQQLAGELAHASSIADVNWLRETVARKVAGRQ